MRRFALFTILPFLLSVGALPGHAHELWIEPVEWSADPGAQLQADLINGERFEGVRQPYLANRTVLFNLYSEARASRIQNRAGSRPALDVPAHGDGLHIAAYQSTPSTLVYDEWEKFVSFAAHKDLGDVAAMHDARGLSRELFTETYTRFSKTLFGVGSGAGADRRVGLETELVALDNPYTSGSGVIRVQLYYQADPRADEQIEIFDRAPSGAVTISTVRTDAEGIATIPVTSGHVYMLDAVVLREPSARLAEVTNASWETLWANLTFHVP